ncbi:MAG: 2-dehydro-3-deoxygalactonokinase [Ginsengibacter sp.]
MNIFLGCDWGTSNFRLQVVNADNGQALEEISTNEGIASTYKNWKIAGENENSRLLFYYSIIEKNIAVLAKRMDISLLDTPLIISGMASSNMGIMELPYAKLPVKADGAGLSVKEIMPGTDAGRTVLLISGVCSTVDVMRGEEIQLAGCAHLFTGRNQLCILPGTHSKHVAVDDGVVAGIKTFMTGELFQLLSTNSTLAIFSKDVQVNADDENFKKGVLEGCHTNLLNSLFHVRSKYLLKQLTPADGYNYLSGLLIGSELAGIAADQSRNIFLIAGQGMRNYYVRAFDVLGIVNVQYMDSSQATLNGQLTVYRNGSSMGRKFKN